MRAVVTGASGAIGSAIVRRLVADGAQVVATGRNETALVKCASVNPAKVTAVVADLSEAGALDALVPSALEVLGGLDLLVCAAGRLDHRAADSVPPESVASAYALNCAAAVRLIQGAAPALRRAQGSAVLIGSTLATRTAPGMLAYSTSKAALHAAGRSFALELAPEVRVNVVAPGVVESEMTRALRPGFSSVEEQLDALRALHPLGRLGLPEEVADAVAFCAQARWLTGAELVLDGGLSLR